MPDPTTVNIDWAPLMGSPLMRGIPLAIGITILTWIITEAASFFISSRYRPVFAMMLGTMLGYVTMRAELLDFGTGPNAWLRSTLCGLLAGALAVTAHSHIKERWPFKLLTAVTPSKPTDETKEGDGEIK